MEKKKVVIYSVISIILVILMIYKGLTQNKQVQNTVDEVQEDQNQVENSLAENTVVNETESENVNNTNEESENISLVSTCDENAFVEGHLKNYPSVGEQYATLIAEKVGINVPIFFGTSEEIFASGMGQDVESYFSGENGSIILAGQNDKHNLDRLRKTNAWR